MERGRERERKKNRNTDKERVEELNFLCMMIFLVSMAHERVLICVRS